MYQSDEVYVADLEFIESFGESIVPPAPQLLCKYWRIDMDSTNQTTTVAEIESLHQISSSEGEQEEEDDLQQDPLEQEATTSQMMEDSNVSISLPEPPSTQEMWTTLENKFSSPKKTPKKSSLKRKTKSEQNPPAASKVRFQVSAKTTKDNVTRCSATKTSGCSGVKPQQMKITATPEQVRQMEEAKERTFFQFLFLVWENVVTLRVLPGLLRELSTEARKTQNLALKKEVLLWQELQEKLESWIDVTCSGLSWNKFKNALYEHECSTIYTRYVMDNEVWSMLIVLYERLLEEDQISKTASSSLPITATTSTLCTTVPIQTTPVVASSPGLLKTHSSGVERNAGLFDNTECQPHELSVPCSISKKHRDNSTTYKSDGKLGDHVLKLDVVPYGEAAKRPKKDWWMEATWRVTTSYKEDSDLGRATRLYLQAVQQHFQSGQVGPLTRENHSARNSWSGFGSTQPRR